MNTFKNLLISKICIYTLCTVIISTCVFVSYDNTLKVHADLSPEYYAVESIVGIAAALAGIVSTPITGGASLALLAPSVLAVINGVDNLHDYFTDNGDGTYTITPEFIQLVLFEAQKIDDTGFHDYESIQNIDGTYNISGYDTFIATNTGHTVYRIYHGSSIYKPFATVRALYGDYSVHVAIITGNSIKTQSPSDWYYDQYAGGEFKGTFIAGVVGFNASSGFGVNVPVFSDMDSAKAALLSGDYSGALNYREKMFEYGSIYAPVYNGGSVTIRKEVLDGFEDKLKEVNEKYDNVDDRINALYEYIFNNGSGNNGSGSGFDFDFDIDSPFDLGELFNGLFKDWSGFGTSFITSLADFFKELADGMKKKFPFSIPWDIYHIFTVFSNVDSPQAADISTISFTDTNSGISVYTLDSEDLEQDVHDAPYFKLPIKVESFGIYEEIIVDMKDFQTLSTFSRTMFSLLFAVFLLKFTIKILSIFGVFGGGDD